MNPPLIETARPLLYFYY